MATIKITSNAVVVLARIANKIELLKDPQMLLRPVCIELIPMITERIHERGIDANGRAIGTYSPGYLKYTRKDYKRGPSAKVIVSLSRKLENEWGVIPTDKGYAIGFIDGQGGKIISPISKKEQAAVSSKQKLLYVEARKGANLTSLSKEETEFAKTRLNELVDEILAG